MLKTNPIHDEVIERLSRQGTAVSDKHILIARSGFILDGESIESMTLSKDKKWVCVPVYNDESSAFFGEYCYSPKCYEIEDIYECYTGKGRLVLTTVYLLRGVVAPAPLCRLS
jgi:hypothetical protein